MAPSCVSGISSQLTEMVLQHTKDKLLQLGKAVHEDTCTNVLGAPLSLWQLTGYLSSTELVRPTQERSFSN